MTTIQEERVRGRPARVGVLQAIRRYPLLAIVPTVLLAAVGGALGFARTPKYTATAQLAVGQLSIADPGAVGSVLQASNQLASVYARAVSSNQVKVAVARANKGAASVSISATPIPDSPLLKVSATSRDASQAVRTANTAAQALITYARTTSSGNSKDTLQRRFHAAALTYVQRNDNLKRLRRSFGPNPSAPQRARLNAAEANVQSALLTREGLRTAYQAAQQTTSLTPPLQSFAVARSTSSDRLRVTEVLVLLGLLAGAALGTALATARLNRRVARLTRP